MAPCALCELPRFYFLQDTHVLHRWVPRHVLNVTWSANKQVDNIILWCCDCRKSLLGGSKTPLVHDLPKNDWPVLSPSRHVVSTYCMLPDPKLQFNLTWNVGLERGPAPGFSLMIVIYFTTHHVWTLDWSGSSSSSPLRSDPPPVSAEAGCSHRMRALCTPDQPALTVTMKTMPSRCRAWSRSLLETPPLYFSDMLAMTFSWQLIWLVTGCACQHSFEIISLFGALWASQHVQAMRNRRDVLCALSAVHCSAKDLGRSSQVTDGEQRRAKRHPAGGDGRPREHSL